MQELKRVGWHIGQPLLPMHLVAQEESILAHLDFHAKSRGIPSHGIASLGWDDTLLMQGVVSVQDCKVIFGSGQIVDVPENAVLPAYDLNKVDKNRVILYLHLLQDKEEKSVAHGQTDLENIVYSIYRLILSTESHTPSTMGVFKFAEFEKNAEGHWKLSSSYIPPLLSMNKTPFFPPILSRIKALLESFQKELEHETDTGQMFQQRTMETKLALAQVAKLRRLILNIDRNVITHPYYLYSSINELIDSMALIFSNEVDFAIIPYQHDKLAPLYGKLIEELTKYLRPQADNISSLSFGKRGDVYVSDKLPQELKDVEKAYFIVQPIDVKESLSPQGVKLASYTRLANIHAYALTGVPLTHLREAPFNNNFSKNACVYEINKHIEWDYVLQEKRAAFRLDGNTEVQAFLYWK